MAKTKFVPQTVTGTFDVIGHHTHGPAIVVKRRESGAEFLVFLSDIPRLIEALLQGGPITLQETKKGQACGWKVATQQS